MVLLEIQNLPNRLFLNKTFLSISFVVTFLNLTACVPKYTKVYEGPDLSKTEIAVVSGEVKGTSPYDDPQGWVSIMKVDGKELGGVWGGGPTEVHLLPGKRVVEMRYESPMQGEILLLWFIEKFRPHFQKALDLEADPGHEYLIKFHKFTNDSVWMTKWKDVVYWIEDRQTGKVVSGQIPDFEPERPFSKCPSMAICSGETKSYFKSLPSLE